MRGNGMSRAPLASVPDGALWRRSRLLEATEDKAARYLDLAGFADDLLDPDDRARVAELLARDATAAADVAEARALARSGAADEPPPDSVVSRACVLVGRRAGVGGVVLAFQPRQRVRMELQGMARWGSLAAAIAVASWLGFTLGMDASRSLVSATAGESMLHETLDPATGLMRDLSEGSQS